MSMNKIKDLLEMFDSNVQIHAEDRVDDVVRTLSGTFSTMPKCYVLEVNNYFITCYKFDIKEHSTSVTVTVFGQRYPTRNLAEVEIEFWLPGVNA